MTAKQVRYRVTLRQSNIELRGYVDTDQTLRDLANVVEATLHAVVIASPASESYDPWAEVGWLRDWQSDMLAFIKSQRLAMTPADSEVFGDLLERAGVQ